MAEEIIKYQARNSRSARLYFRGSRESLPPMHASMPAV